MAGYFVSSVSGTKGGLFFFDSRSGSLELLLPGRFRGLTFGPDGWLYAVTGTRRHLAGVPTRIFRLHPKTGESEEIGVVPWKACHDLRWYGGCFYLVASIGNYVIRYDAVFRELDRLQLVDNPGDVCHVNCLAEREGELYASLFTLSPGTREEKRLTTAWATEGKVVKLDFTRGGYEVGFEPLAQPHSMNWQGDALYLVESHTSRITRVDLANHSSRVVAQLTGFLRGLAFQEAEVVVGACGMFRDERQRSSRVPLATRLRERFRPFEGLIVLDPHSWAIARQFPCEGAEVYDIILEQPGAGKAS